MCRRLCLVGVIGLSAQLAMCTISQAMTVDASVDRTEVQIGEPVRLTLEVAYDTPGTVAPEPVSGMPETFTIDGRGSTTPVVQAGRASQSLWLDLRLYDTGTHTIPPITITYRVPNTPDTQVSSDPITLTVASLLPQDWEAQDIRDIKPPLRLRQVRWWLWIIGGLLLCSAMGAMWWWHRRRTVTTLVIPPTPPDRIAAEALAALRREGLAAQGRHEEYHVRLSAIIRTYIECRFRVRAPDMTTEEFLEEAARAEALSHDHRLLLRQFLAQCDMVKFAQYRPSTDEADMAMTAAEQFVDDTRPVAATPEATSHVT